MMNIVIHDANVPVYYKVQSVCRLSRYGHSLVALLLRDLFAISSFNFIAIYSLRFMFRTALEKDAFLTWS